MSVVPTAALVGSSTRIWPPVGGVSMSNWKPVTLWAVASQGRFSPVPPSALPALLRSKPMPAPQIAELAASITLAAVPAVHMEPFVLGNGWPGTGVVTVEHCSAARLPMLLPQSPYAYQQPTIPPRSLPSKQLFDGGWFASMGGVAVLDPQPIPTPATTQSTSRKNTS